ncbi:MAG: cytochrome c3 family protein [Bacteroidales bacterium]|nr:cytochrome c3 family protein [Bacteroidales bacterium]MBN2749023.1 cytochrome c3 family protein [Bacteroidales bacterium]
MRSYLLIVIVSLCSALSGVAMSFSLETTPDSAAVRGINNSTYAHDNVQNCLRCHGELYYTIEDTLSGSIKRRLMSDHLRISTDEFYGSVHWNFSCLDCHSEGYAAFPHALDLRFEEAWGCIDCHGYDEKFAKFNFESIEQEFQKSVHYTAMDGAFTCWECHNPHSYKVQARESLTSENFIVESNKMCLSCHGSPEKFGLYSDKKLGAVMTKHDWLPNQTLHLQAVRCIECHTMQSDDVMVAHFVTPKDDAVKNCVDCHSQNSILVGSLYKFQSKEARSKYGVLNGVILSNDSYVIGANRNLFISYAGIAAVVLTLLGIAIHSIFRIIIKR